MTMVDAEEENARFEKREFSCSLHGIVTTTPTSNLVSN